MGFHRSRNRRRAASYVNDDLALQIQSRKVVNFFFRNFQAIAYENRGCFDRRRIRRRNEEALDAELHGFGFSVAQQFERGVFFVELQHIELDRLRVTPIAGGLQSGRLELVRDVRRGFGESFGAGAAAFQFVVRQILHVRPPGPAMSVPVLRCAHADHRERGQQYSNGEFKIEFHDSHLTFFHRKPDSSIAPLRAPSAGELFRAAHRVSGAQVVRA